MISQISQQTNPPFATLCAHYADLFPLLLELKNTPQDPQWHGEGDVATHTRMVLDALYESLDQLNLDAESRVAVVLAALFHDIAKATTTRTKTIEGIERIVSPRHASLGRDYLAYRLPDLGLSQVTRHQVLSLVGHHHDWRDFVASSKSTHDLRRFRSLVDHRLLALLERADIRGRICDDKAEQLEQLEFFRTLFEEHDERAESDDEFVSALSELIHDLDASTRKYVLDRSRYELHRGIVHTANEAWSRSFSYREDFSHLVVLNGPSGSGKSTFAQEQFEGYEMVSLDEIRREFTGDPSDQSYNGQVRQEAKSRLKRLLAKHENVVWDATCTRRDFRRVPIQIGFDYGAHVELVVFETTLARCIENNKRRTRQVPLWVIERQFERAEFPYSDEAHRVRYVSSDTKKRG